MSSPLPTPKDVRDLLTVRIGRTVTIAPSVPYAPAPDERATYAVYVDQQIRTCAVVACDPALSILAGAALAKIPVGGVEDELARRSPGPMTREHLQDLLEAFGPWFESPGGSPVRLHAAYPPGTEPPSDVPAYARTLGRRLDLEVTIPAYGSGLLSLVRPAL